MQYYRSKLLLFGEHIVVTGARALAILYDRYSGHWDYADTDLAATLQQDLPKFADYLDGLKEKKNLFLNIDTFLFSHELAKGLFFNSNIPSGYGVGSSGALCAAIYSRFGKEPSGIDMPELKKGLAQMENYFHGSSSGTDPLICYLDHPVLIGKETIQKVNIPKQGLRTLFTLDTGVQRQTGPLVKIFLKKSQEDSYRYLLEKELIPATEKAIDYLTEGKDSKEAFRQISEFQLNHFEEMIPPRFRPMWKEGLEKESYYLKICGAGGGGFLLGWAEKIPDKIGGFPCRPILKN